MTFKNILSQHPSTSWFFKNMLKHPYSSFKIMVSA